MSGMAGYPKGFYTVLLLVLVALTVTGLLLLPHMLTMRMDWDVPVEVSGELRLTSAALHCAAAFIVMSLLGALSMMHMRTGWRRRKNRISGSTMLLLFAVLMLSAVGVYYFGDEDLSRWSSLIHSVAGVLLVAAVLWHGVAGYLIRRQDRRQQLRAIQRSQLTRVQVEVELSL